MLHVRFAQFKAVTDLFVSEGLKKNPPTTRSLSVLNNPHWYQNAAYTGSCRRLSSRVKRLPFDSLATLSNQPLPSFSALFVPEPALHNAGPISN